MAFIHNSSAPAPEKKSNVALSLSISLSFFSDLQLLVMWSMVMLVSGYLEYGCAAFGHLGYGYVSFSLEAAQKTKLTKYLRH